MENQNFTLYQKEFLQSLKAQGKSGNTIKNYRTDIQCFNHYLESRYSDLELKDFSWRKTQEYGKYITQKYRSDNSRRRRIQALRLFFDFLVDKKVYRENPIRKLSPGPKFLDIPRPTPFPDVQKLWNYLIQWGDKDGLMRQLTGVRNQVLFMLIYNSGLKVSDIARLKTKHIDNTLGEPRVMVISLKRDPYSVPHSPCV